MAQADDGPDRVTSSREVAAPRRHEPWERVVRLGNFGSRKAAFWREGVRWRSRTYAELQARIHGSAARLAAAGLGAGEPVLIQGPDHPDWIEVLFGTFLLGGVAVPLEVATPAPFREAVARTVGARLMVAPPGIDPPPGCRRIDFGDWGAAAPPARSHEPVPDGRAEIVFTSGTTGEPKGVVLTHANLAADFAPLEAAFLRRERLVAPLGEIRFLSTLPMSHMFGQAMNVFVPLFMGLTVAFVPPRPRDILDAAPRLGAWGLFTVPRLMELLAGEMRREAGNAAAVEKLEAALARHAGRPFWIQRLLFRLPRRQLGWKFALFVSGGAALTDPVREFWERCGYLIVQGYGLTETAPIISISNPFRRGRGGVGRALAGQEVKIGADGEIMVRGANVTPGYFGAEGSAPGGWLRTGDVGEIDADGHLVIRGRLKDVIVTPEGENVYASDVETAFHGGAGLRDVCVFGLPYEGGERVHAALILEPGAEAEVIVGRANEGLLPKQRVRDYTVWPGADFPRTATGKVRRMLVRERAVAMRQGAADPGVPAAGAGGVRRLVAQLARVPVDRLQPSTRLVEDLGLASLDLVELAAAAEQEFGVALPEDRMAAATVGDLEEAARAALEGGVAPVGDPGSRSAGREGSAGVGPGEGAAPRPAVGVTAAAGPDAARRTSAGPGRLRMPYWSRWPPVHMMRRALEETAYRAVVRTYARPQVDGLEHLARTRPPYLFVANHHSYMDTGLFKTALPFALRGRIAPGMTTRYHRVFFGEVAGSRGRCLVEGLQAGLVEFFFGAWPLPETAGFRRSLTYAGELMDRGVSILIFPEGRHVPEGVTEPFRPGVGIFARELRAPVIPVHVSGTAAVLPDEAWWPRFGRTRMVLGAPITIAPEADAGETARQLEAAVRGLAPR
jgi:long-chain acyl-CoA synthetase